MKLAAGFHPDLGAEVTSEGVRFRVWAPAARTVGLCLTAPERRLCSMTRKEDDVWEVLVPGLKGGAEYLFVLDEQRSRPDPRSRYQPNGPHAASQVVDPRAYSWSDQGFSPPPLQDLVIYELHIGTFTREGTFDAARARVKELVDLGITAFELMPVAEFPGARNWGYDGVSLFAPSSAYGGPDALRRFVDECHAHGAAVILDVVYNHLGPEGNYLAEFGPYFTSKYRTPWGDAINYDGAGSDQVRQLVIDNALSWVVEYHVDGLRLDAIHGIFDQSALPILQELSVRVHAEAFALGRPIHVIAESDLNDPRTTRPISAGGLGLDAQWNDDFHHALHTIQTGTRHGYFADFGRTRDLSKAISKGFVYDGRYSPYRRRRHGHSCNDLRADRLVVFTQNHDQIANGSGGARASTLLSVADQKIAALLLCVGPNIPLLFMGQEYGETSPFHYFVSHSDKDLARAVREGRRKEFEGFGWEESFHDPQDSATFLGSKLAHWGSTASPHGELRRLYRDLLALRRRHAALGADRSELFRVDSAESPRWISIERGHESGAGSLVLVNFEREAVSIPMLEAAGPRWHLALWTRDPKYGGPKDAKSPPSVIDIEDGALARLTLPGRTGVIYIEAPHKEASAG